MSLSDTSYNLRIELDTHNCALSPSEIERFEEALGLLRSPTEKFPVSDLYITVTYQPRSTDYRVTTALVLPGRTLAAGDLEKHPYPAFERCVRKLARRLESYEAELDHEAELAKHQKGTEHDVIPEHEPDAQTLEETVAQQDYSSFRRAMYVYEEAVRKRIGRWVQRYPKMEARIGVDLELADIVEEVFLNAFERWNERPQEVLLGDWLEHLIDPSIRLLAEHPTRELENVSFARTLHEQ